MGMIDPTGKAFEIRRLGMQNVSRGCAGNFYFIYNKFEVHHSDNKTS